MYSPDCHSTSQQKQTNKTNILQKKENSERMFCNCNADSDFNGVPITH